MAWNRSAVPSRLKIHRSGRASALPPRRAARAISASSAAVRSPYAEALTNAVRYAAASEVRIDGRVVDGRLVVSVTDDGRGGADRP